MPLLMLETNQELSEENQEQLLKQLSITTAEALGKPERYVMISLRHNSHMMFAGSRDPLAYLELKSIGLPADRTTELSNTLSNLVTSALDIAIDRVYIEFSDAERHLWGWNGGTFAR